MERFLENKKLTYRRTGILKKEIKEAIEFFIKAGAVSPENKWKRGIEFTGPWASPNYNYYLKILWGLHETGLLERRKVGETKLYKYRIADIEMANEILNYDNFI